jgi:hypothetical protein
MEYIGGMMADNTKDIGKMANNMVLEDTYWAMVKVKLVYGTMDRERDGWMERIK